MPYIAYDIRGIQQYIFSVPKLKFIVGGSVVLDRFDNEYVPQIAGNSGGQIRFSGGGKGIIEFCKTEDGTRIKDGLLKTAKTLGVDLRLGVAGSLAEALEGAEELFPFVPDCLDGEPCGVSGLWPTGAEGKGWLANVHPVVRRKYEEYKTDEFGARILEELSKRPEWPTALEDVPCLFMKNVSPDRNDDEGEQAHARAAQRNLGSRNRWAVVAMDGNDIGRQQRALDKLPDREKDDALANMSRQLRECTRNAFLAGLAGAIAAWAKQSDGKIERLNTGEAVLPFRPLILGGDDILALCHVAHAFELARNIARTFETESAKTPECWPATGGKLAMSAGVLFCGVGYPLHTAIPYAESLLASAKGRFRDTSGEKPSPAAIDWESATENLLDSPAARRRRELCFVDQDLQPGGRPLEVSLTRRPYRLYGDGKPGNDAWNAETFDELARLSELLEAIPPSARMEIRRRLRAPWADRCAFVASLNKNLVVGGKSEPERLSDLLQEYPAERRGKAWRDKDQPNGSKIRDTALCDAIAILEESRRMSVETA
ncbi:MAG: hypothetical protein LBE84_02255 [Planctomycetota bacterium]|jgi:hypothetical protein|nr:hypothetical protein [Planctomycetota bacterium]